MATKVSIRYYDLARCILLKKCSPGTAHVGAIAYDHTGDVSCYSSFLKYQNYEQSWKQTSLFDPNLEMLFLNDF